jgi:hypothetical protein
MTMFFPRRHAYVWVFRSLYTTNVKATFMRMSEIE